MIVNDTPGEACRIAVLQDGHLDELYEETAATATNVGNIYKGRVTNVESAIQAAFIDYGEGQNGFLHISDLHPRYFPGEEQTERVGKKTPRRERPLIQNALKRGDEVLVQVMKEGIGTKGPTLTSYLSIAGRLLVCMPYLGRVGVSRKVEDEDLRREARKTLDQIELPEGFGFILRTAGIGRTKTDLKRDVAYLMRLWKVMEKRIEKVGAPCELYTESDLLIRTCRDVLRPSIKAVIVDNDSAYERLNAFLRVIAPRSAPQIVRYHDAAPIFHVFDIERQIDLIHAREVPLPSGGSLVIDQTEALVAIDVNSGKSRSSKNSETNALKTNTEAVDEICRQLRLRDLGGLIINDLIDMRQHRHRRAIEERLSRNLKLDRAKTTVLPISEFGLVEMTRQRMRPSVRKAHFVECSHCAGHGDVKSPDSVAAATVRQIRYLLNYDKVARVEVLVSTRVASVMLSRRRRELVRIEEETGKSIDVRVSDKVAADHISYYAYDDRSADINVDMLPRLKKPDLKTLIEIEEAGGPAIDDEDSAQGGGHKRRRRRRRSGPADATAIALAGGFEPDAEPDEDITTDNDGDDASKDGRKKRRRRRRRRGGGRSDGQQKSESTATIEPQDAGDDQAKADVVEETKRAANIRVHQLAKELAVTSKDVLAKAASDDDVDLKNHMSSVDAATAEVIRGWFADSDETTIDSTTEASTDEEASSDDEPKRKRRRRGRRGGRGRRRKTSDGGGDVDAGSASASSEGDAMNTSGETEAGADDDAAADAGPVSANGVASMEDDASDDAAAPEKKKRVSRKKTTRRKTAKAPKDDGADIGASDDEAKDATSSGDTIDEADTPKPKRRRSLYRNRKPAGATLREPVRANAGDDA